MPPPALVADDDPAVRSVVAAILSSGGFDVTAVGDGVQAADSLLDPAGPTFAVAVVDCEMPGLDGPGVLARARAAGCRVPVLLISGSADPAAIPGLATDPIAAFLPKPFTRTALTAAVSALVAGGTP